MDTIGFIGAGVMGASMVRNLLKTGYPVCLYTRTRAKAESSWPRARAGRTRPPL